MQSKTVTGPTNILDNRQPSRIRGRQSPSTLFCYRALAMRKVPPVRHGRRCTKSFWTPLCLILDSAVRCSALAMREAFRSFPSDTDGSYTKSFWTPLSLILDSAVRCSALAMREAFRSFPSDTDGAAPNHSGHPLPSFWTVTMQRLHQSRAVLPKPPHEPVSAKLAYLKLRQLPPLRHFG